MKITKATLKRIIKEEISEQDTAGSEEEELGGDAPAQQQMNMEKVASVIKKLVQRINRLENYVSALADEKLGDISDDDEGKPLA